MIRYQEKINNTNTDLAENHLMANKNEIKLIPKKLDKLQEEYLSDLLNDFARERNNQIAEMLSIRLQELENNNSVLQDEIEEKSNRQISEKGMGEAFKELESVYYSADRLLKKSLLRALIKRIEVSKDRKRLESIEFCFS